MATIPWEQVRDVVDAVLDLPAEARTAYLDQFCPDTSLRLYVESLILSYEQAGSFLAVPAAASQSAETDAWRGRRIGVYEILDLIGEGGMGEVYRARRADDQFQKEVAIKLVRTGFDSRFTLARFKAERQILANLDHPNITRLLDGGATEEGQPYLVMEYVRGLPLDEYCDRRRLSITERLELFRTVCGAVQYAHQNLVIHRDLKPGNILVTEEGTPKLLDFGIAKILDESAGAADLRTMTMVRLLTPEYASPEQLRGETIATASDVYSLGVVLYELLTGQRPYRVESRAPEEMVRAVVESAPEKPSTAVTREEESTDSTGKPRQRTPALVSETREGSMDKLRRRLSGDLDNIVLMALRKEPQRRYASVEQFSEDLRRHLAGLPVIARTDTFRYRSSKFVRRHTTAVAAGTLLLLSLVGGVAATLRQARISAAQRRIAEQRLKDVRALASSYLFEFHDAIQDLPGSAAARHLVIKRGLEYLDKLNREARGDPELMNELASGYQRIAGLQGNFSGPGIGDTKAALESYQKAVALREALLAASPTDWARARADLRLLGAYWVTLIKTGRTGEARRVAQRALNLAEGVSRSRPQDPEAWVDLVRAHTLLAAIMGGEGSSASTREIAGAIEHDRAALKLLGQLGPGAQNARAKRAAFITTITLGLHLSKARQFTESRGVFDGLMPALKQDKNLDVRDALLFLNWRGILFERWGDQRQALTEYERDYRRSRELAQADSRDLIARLDLDIAQAHLGMQEARLGNTAAGKKLLDAAIADGESLLASDPAQSFYASLLAAGYSYQGETLTLMGNQEGARLKYAMALATAKATAQHDPEDLEARLNVAKGHASVGVVLARAAHYDEAQQEFNLARATAGEILRARPQDNETLYLADLIRRNTASIAPCANGKPCGAIELLQLPTPMN